MKKLINIFFILPFLVLANSLLAQEREYDLSSNPRLFSKNISVQSESKISTTYKKVEIFLKDTLSLALPFLDDFSSNKFTSYAIDDYNASAKSNAVRYSFKVNSAIVDTVNYITDTAYTYTYDPNTNTLDSSKVLFPDYVINLYDDIINPTQITSSIDGWIPYTKPIYDTLADTILYTFLVKLDTTRLLEIDSITFINTHIFPTTTLWYENEVFVNSNYPINPPSIGVATFDGLDSTGYPYDFVNPNAFGLADKLTSKYLDLGIPLGANDSIILSFFYQPKGRGNTPESTDSLVLDFKAIDGSWSHVWSKPGRPLSPDTSFFKVDIRISNSSFLFDGFQFRFKNYATLSGNVDHWHLDYVRLKKITTSSDLIINDIAFVYPSQSFLKDYHAVPYTQYDTNMMKTSISNTIINLNTAPLNYGFYTYSVVDHYGNSISNYAPGVTTNILPGANFNFPIATNPPVIFNYSDTISACKDFIITHERTGTPDQIITNDKISFVQHITDYFAYDDASAESAYGVVQAGGQAALKFTLNKPDQISGAFVYFNPVVDNAADKVFKLTLWEDISGLPGNIIYQNPKNYSPTYNALIDGFYKLDLDSIIALPAGSFYIGWVQSTADELNVGLDKNTNNGDKLFYNIGSGWVQSIISGSLMLHPVFSSCPALYIGVNEKKKIEESVVEIYPNPATEKIYFKIDKPYAANLFIVDLTGKIILSKSQNLSESIDISSLNEGIYFVRVENVLLHTFVNKKIVVLK